MIWAVGRPSLWPGKSRRATTCGSGFCDDDRAAEQCVDEFNAQGLTSTALAHAPTGQRWLGHWANHFAENFSKYNPDDDLAPYLRCFSNLLASQVLLGSTS